MVDLRKVIGIILLINVAFLLFFHSAGATSETPIVYQQTLAPLFEDKKPWPVFLSPQWDEYESTSNFTGTFQNLKKDMNYCTKVKEFQDKYPLPFKADGLPPRENRVVYCDYSKSMFVHKVVEEKSRTVLTNHWAGIKDAPEKDDLRPDITMFFQLTSSWHRNFKIGSQFLCPGQLYNHIPGNAYLNFKDLTALTMREYGKYYEGREKCFNPWEVMPHTLVLFEKEQCEEFVESLKKDKNPDKIKWIYKKSRYSHNGSGLQVVDAQIAKELLELYSKPQGCENKNDKYLAQKYIPNPFLINGKKFDFRAYMFIASTDPLMILYHDGFLRVSMADYDEDSSNPAVYLTNTHITEDYLKSKNMTQDDYNQFMEDQGWDFDHFNRFMVNSGHVDKNWMNDYVKKYIKWAMFHIVRMNLDHLLRHPGVFEIYGLDFLLDEDFKLWFIELNLTPSIAATSKEKEKINKKFVSDQIDLEYARLYGADFDSILKTTNFEWVYDGRKQEMERYHGLITPDCV
ncbi:unnamed protein product [Blepharisma stoltei]|uniref:Uncharacterized protein n=1 Tax=Blepharisma stoltei TaxID=1481888 RepID=A0AAU9K5H3_9CILI|nr:unnamed protein product [Blepharisma stoltei]